MRQFGGGCLADAVVFLTAGLPLHDVRVDIQAALVTRRNPRQREFAVARPHTKARRRAWDCFGHAGRVRPLEGLPFDIVVCPDAHVIRYAVGKPRDGVGQIVLVRRGVFTRRVPVIYGIGLPLDHELLDVVASCLRGSDPGHVELPVTRHSPQLSGRAGHGHRCACGLRPVVSGGSLSVVRPDANRVGGAVDQQVNYLRCTGWSLLARAAVLLDPGLPLHDKPCDARTTCCIPRRGRPANRKLFIPGNSLQVIWRFGNGPGRLCILVRRVTGVVRIAFTHSKHAHRVRGAVIQVRDPVRRLRWRGLVRRVVAINAGLPLHDVVLYVGASGFTWSRPCNLQPAVPVVSYVHTRGRVGLLARSTRSFGGGLSATIGVHGNDADVEHSTVGQILGDGER